MKTRTPAVIADTNGFAEFIAGLNAVITIFFFFFFSSRNIDERATGKSWRVLNNLQRHLNSPRVKAAVSEPM
jgi:hypothetical protein